MWEFNLCLERPKIKDPFCQGNVYTPMIYGQPTPSMLRDRNCAEGKYDFTKCPGDLILNGFFVTN